MDLNCLEPQDAIQILKTKIFENSLIIQNSWQVLKNKKPIIKILQIVCGKQQFVDMNGK